MQREGKLLRRGCVKIVGKENKGEGLEQKVGEENREKGGEKFFFFWKNVKLISFKKHCYNKYDFVVKVLTKNKVVTVPSFLLQTRPPSHLYICCSSLFVELRVCSSHSCRCTLLFAKQFCVAPHAFDHSIPSISSESITRKHSEKGTKWFFPLMCRPGCPKQSSK